MDDGSAAFPVAEPSLYVFHIEVGPDDDALLRVLTPFAVVSARLTSARMGRAGDRASIRIEAEGLDARRAQTLVERLANMAVVRGIGFGWRSPVGLS